MDTSRPVCFVIAPFNETFTDYYKTIVQPAIAAAGLEPKRGDEFHTVTPIMSDIWESIVTCQVCLVDVSENNPNVLFELGLAMAIDKPVVIISQTPEKLPFDLKSERVIHYHPAKLAWQEQLKADITMTLKGLVDQNITIRRQVWKNLLTPAETMHDLWRQHGRRANAIDLADKLEPTYADDFFVTQRQKENELIAKAESEIWLVSETGALMLQDNFGKLIPFLRKGGKLRLLLVSKKIHKLVIKRHLFQSPNYLPDRYQTTREYLAQLTTETGVEVNSEQLQVRWLSFPVSFVGVFIEPTAPAKQSYSVIRFIGFRTVIEKEPSIVLRGDLSPKTFTHYLDEFDHLWNAASPEG